MTRHRHTWTPAQDAQIAEMIAAGSTFRQVAERLGMTRLAIAARAKRLGIRQPEHIRIANGKALGTPKQARFTPEQQVQILEWAAEGYSPEEIGNRLGGFSAEAIKGRLKRIRRHAKQNGWKVEIKMTRQDQVAERVSNGMTFAEIAADLAITENAVKQAFIKICRNLGRQAQ